MFVSNVRSSLLWRNILVKVQRINNVETHKSFARSTPLVCCCHTSKHARLLVALHTCTCKFSPQPQCEWSRTTTAMMFSLQSLSLAVSHCCYNKNDVTTTTSLQLPQSALLVSQIRCQEPCEGIASYLCASNMTWAPKVHDTARTGVFVRG
jgi:hypothetical protein